jgi:hypothetical protein
MGEGISLMLDRKVVELTDGLIQWEFTQRRQCLTDELQAADEQFNARGALNSSMHVQRVVAVCRQEIEARGWIVYNAHTRVLSQLAIEPYPELSQDLKGRLSYFLSLSDDYAQAPKNLATRIGLQSQPDIRVHEARDHVLAKLGTEIDLYVETLARRKKKRDDRANGMPIYNFYSPVGAFQTGSGSSANVVQHIASHDKEALQQALCAVREALSRLSDTQDFPKKEIIEIVDDAHAELSKPSPNRVKLTSMLTTVGDTIRLMGSMNSAYQLLKTALLPFGITMP